MKPPEFSVYAKCTYEFNGREYRIHVDERGDATVDIETVSGVHFKVVVASHDSFRDLSVLSTFDLGKTWIDIIDARIIELRKLVKS